MILNPFLTIRRNKQILPLNSEIVAQLMADSRALALMALRPALESKDYQEEIASTCPNQGKSRNYSKRK